MAATNGLAAVLVTEGDLTNRSLRALAPDEPLVLSSAGMTHYLLEYPFDHPTLGLNPGDLPAPGPDDCASRSLGEPTRTSRLSFDPGLVLEDAPREFLRDVRLPALDLAACAARRGCLELEAGFAICKPACTTVNPIPPTPPAPPAPPRFCDESGCPNLERACDVGRNLPGQQQCLDLGPCGAEEFRPVPPAGPRPSWVSVTAAPGGDGSQGLPYRTLAEALAQGATDVYLSAGVHQAPPRLTAAVRIYGVCPARTTVLGPLLSDQDLSLFGINLQAGQQTLTVRSAELELREVRLSGSSTLAIQLENSNAQISRSEFVGAGQEIAAVSSLLTITESHFGPSSQPSVDAVIRASGSTVAIEGVRFDGPGARTAISAVNGGKLTVLNSAFSGLARAIEARQVDLELTDVNVEVRGVYPHVPEVGAVGVLSGSHAILRRVRIVGATSHAILVRASRLVVEDLITMDTGAGLPGVFELPTVFIRRGLDAHLERWRSTHEVQALDTIHEDHRVEVRDLEVLGDGGRPVVAIRSESPLGLDRIRIGARQGPGLTVARGAVVDVRDLAVEGASDGLLFEIDGKLSGERVAITAERGIFGTASGLRLSNLRIEARSAGVEIGEFVGTSTSPPEFVDFALSVAAGPAFNFGAPPRPPLTLRSGALDGDPGPAARCAPTWGWRIEDLQLGP